MAHPPRLITHRPYRRDARARQIAAALSRGFTPAELDILAQAAPLLERLGQCL